MSRGFGVILSIALVLSVACNIGQFLTAKGRTSVTTVNAMALPNLKDDRYYNIVNIGSGKYVEVKGGDCARGEGVEMDQYAPEDEDNQRFRVAYNSNLGVYAFEARQSKDVIDLPAEAQNANGTQLRQHTYTGARNQLWRILPNGDDTFRIQSYTGAAKVFDIKGGGTPDALKDNEPLTQWDWNGGAGQRFTFRDTGIQVQNTPPHHCDLEKLVEGKYQGPIELLYGAQHVYLACQKCNASVANLPDAHPAALDEVWNIDQGQYNNIKGAWIKWIWPANVDPKKHEPYYAWQPNGKNSPIVMWNKDQEAQGPPEDLEMFYFEPVDTGNNTMRIRNSDLGYVYEKDHYFYVGADQASAAVITAYFAEQP